MNIQLLIIIIIGISVAAIVGRSLYRFFSTPRHSSHCGGCAGCNISKKQ